MAFINIVEPRSCLHIFKYLIPEKSSDATFKTEAIQYTMNLFWILIFYYFTQWKQYQNEIDTCKSLSGIHSVYIRADERKLNAFKIATFMRSNIFSFNLHYVHFDV